MLCRREGSSLLDFWLLDRPIPKMIGSIRVTSENGWEAEMPPRENSVCMCNKRSICCCNSQPKLVFVIDNPVLISTRPIHSPNV